MTFESLGLKPELLSAVREQGYDTPTPVQAQAIPIVLQGQDLIAGAQTGTGKTAAFTLPLLQLLSSGNQGSGRPRVRALILTPTRELAMQVEESVRTYGKHLSLRSATIFGGVNITPQIRALRNGVDILVATPGRLLDHYSQGTLDFRALEILVLDEADRMLDMGFIRDIRKILSLLPAKRQNLLFSATFNEEIRGLAAGILHDPQSVDVAQRNTTTELVKHVIHPVDKDKKKLLLVHLIQSRGMYQALVFTRTKHGSNHLATHLLRSNITCAAIHGDKSQNQRVRALADFKAGKIQVLVATDIAARGLDIDQLPHVINFELPQVAEDYVHRIGRTGRAGSEGEAMSLVCLDELGLLRDIEKLLKRNLPQEVIPGWEPDPNAPIEPIQKPRGGRFAPSGGRNDRGGRPAENNRAPRNDRPSRPAAPARSDSAPRRDAPPRAPQENRAPRTASAPRSAQAHKHEPFSREERPARQNESARRASSPEMSRSVKNLVDQTVGGSRMSRKDISPIR